MAQAPAALKEMAGNDQWKMATPSDGLLKGKWWEIFGDPQLNRLEELVNINNQNVKQAEAQFRQARALVAANHANYYPTIGSTPAITQSDTGTNTAEERGTSQSFSLPATATWEPDLWGRVRLSVENAVSNAQVSAADLENIRLSQQALLATDYFLLAAQDMQLDGAAAIPSTPTRRTCSSPSTASTAELRRGPILPWRKPSLRARKAQSTDLHVARAQYEHAIAVLTGQPPASLEIGASKIGGPPPPIPMAVPSQLLERRPDIAANERLVAAANANVGIAETAYYPTLTLSASAGLLSHNLANLFTYASRSWSAGPVALSDAVRFRPPWSRAGGRPGRLRRHRRRLPADGSLRLSGSRGRSCEFALPCGRGGAAAGSRGSRPGGAESRDATGIGRERIPI